MKVMLLKDVYKLGHAGEVKEVKAGFGRNYLIPQGLAALATPGVLKNADRIRAEADTRRAELNQELSGVAERIEGTLLTFPARAGETGKLFGSVTTRMIADALNEELGTDLSHHQIDSQPLRALGEHTVPVRLTMDLVPEIKVIVYREGESAAAVLEEMKALEAAEEMEADLAEGESGEMAEAGTELVESEAEEMADVAAEFVEGKVEDMPDMEASVADIDATAEPPVDAGEREESVAEESDEAEVAESE